MDESLLRSTLPKDANVQNSAVYKQFSGATATVRRERLMPFLWRTFAVDLGFVAGDRAADSAVSVTNRHWFSYPGYSEILTGQAHDDLIKSNDPIRNKFPSVFQYIQRKRQLTPAQIATFASWSVFSSIVESEEGSDDGECRCAAICLAGPQMQWMNAMQNETPTPWDNVRYNAYTFRFAMDYLKRMHPRVLYIAFDETDDWAHDGRYDLVLRALNRTDAYLKELWETLQADPQYRGKTAVILVTDHGRGKTADDWRKHGKDVVGADEIWLAVASPGSPRRGLWRNPGAALSEPDRRHNRGSARPRLSRAESAGWQGDRLDDGQVTGRRCPVTKPLIWRLGLC